MELDSINIKRLIKIYRYYIEKNWRRLLIRFVAFVYLFSGFTFFALYFSYNIRIAAKPLGYFLILMITQGLFLLYILINHLLIRIVVSHKTLLIFDLLTIIMLVCIFLSDLWA